MTVQDEKPCDSSERDRGIPTIETERLILRPMTLDDAGAVQRLAGDVRIAETTLSIPHPYPDGAAEQWIETHSREFAEEKGVVWAMTLPESGELFGSIGLIIAAAHDRAEMGYWVGVPHWNQGYASEAAKAVFAYAFNVRGFHRITLHHFSTNPASGRIAEKLGMKREGVVREHVKKWDRYMDVVVHGILRKEYDVDRG